MGYHIGVTRANHIRAILRKAYAILENWDGATSISFSSPSGGSVSRSFAYPKDVTEFIDEWESKLAAAIAAETGAGGISVNYARWC